MYPGERFSSYKRWSDTVSEREIVPAWKFCANVQQQRQRDSTQSTTDTDSRDTAGSGSGSTSKNKQRSNIWQSDDLRTKSAAGGEKWNFNARLIILGHVGQRLRANVQQVRKTSDNSWENDFGTNGRSGTDRESRTAKT